MPLPKKLQITYGAEKEVKVRDFLAERKKFGQIKQCPDCLLFMGSSWVRCGICEENKKAKFRADLIGEEKKEKKKRNHA